jgi:hypothetical protein
MQHNRIIYVYCGLNIIIPRAFARKVKIKIDMIKSFPFGLNATSTTPSILIC